MKGYETYFNRCKNPEYGDSYVDYELHKGKLRGYYSRRHDLANILREGGGALTSDAFSRLVAAAPDDGGATGGSGRDKPPAAVACTSSYFCYEDDGRGGEGATHVDSDDAVLRLSIMERKEFGSLLEEQISKSAVFYASTLLPRVESLVRAEEYRRASVGLLEAIAFACTNVITFRQLLIRYDAFCRAFDGMPLSEWHLQRSVLDVDHPVHGLFSLDGADDLEKRIVMGLQKQAVAGGGGSGRGDEDDGVLVGRDGVLVGRDGEEEGTTSADDDVVREFTSQVQSFVYLMEKTDSSLEKAVAGHVVFRDRLLNLGLRVRRYLLFGFQKDGLVNEPSMRGRHFKREVKIIGKWRQTKDFSHFSIEDDRRGTFRRNLRDIRPENVFPLLLNLVSCFLFMMNNYIIEPSSAYYAEALGSSDALSGLMIGAAPWFALISSVVYSYWTNYNYKRPILFAGVLQFVGNLMYANAYGYRSVELCLIGRAITGLGAPRIINRRYVADATPFSLRTAASAAFAMATALGAAMGPGMAIVLDSMDDFEFYLPFLKQQQFNGMTGPGYFMAFNWLVYTLCIVFFFGEPTRSGLEELKRREEQESSKDPKRESLLDEVELAAMSDGKADRRAAGESSLDAVLERQDSLSLDDEEDCMTDEGSLHLEEVPDVDSSKHDKGYRYNYCSCVKHLTRPTLICMGLIFMKRIALESIVGSTSIITKNRYGWSIKNVGTLHLVNGIIVIPVSIFAGYLSTLYEDRYMSVWFLAITLFGMAFLFDPTDLLNHDDDVAFNEGQPLAVGPVRYVLGSLIAFSGIEACESYVASLMSKVVPFALAKGTFNSGLLETLVGTGGRATGDVFITLMGLISIRNLLNLLIIPGATLVATSILIILWNYDLLAV